MYCRRCLYPLEGIALRDEEPRGRCPECGLAFDPGQPKTYLQQPRRDVEHGWLRWILMASIAYPLILAAVPYADCLYVRLTLGRWPVPMLDDPKDCGLWLFHLLFVIGAVVSLPAIVITSVAVILALVTRPRGWWWLAPLVVVAWVGVIRLFLSDPGDVFLWYGD